MKLKNRLALLLLKIIVKRCKKQEIKLKAKGGGDAIVAQAYRNMIKSYEDAIQYLKAQIKQ